MVVLIANDTDKRKCEVPMALTRKGNFKAEIPNVTIVLTIPEAEVKSLRTLIRAYDEALPTTIRNLLRDIDKKLP